MRRGSADSIRASGQKAPHQRPDTKLQSACPLYPNRSLRSGRRPYKGAIGAISRPLSGRQTKVQALHPPLATRPAGLHGRGVGSRASVRSCCVARRSAACCCDERPGVWVDPGQIGLGYSGQAAMCALHATPLLCPAAPDHVTRGDLNPSAGRQPEQPSKQPTFLQSAKPEGRTAHDRSYELG